MATLLYFSLEFVFLLIFNYLNNNISYLHLIIHQYSQLRIEFNQPLSLIPQKEGKFFESVRVDPMENPLSYGDFLS